MKKNINIVLLLLACLLISGTAAAQNRELGDSTLNLELSLKDSVLNVKAMQGSDTLKLTAQERRELRKEEKARAKELERELRERTIGGELVSADTVAMVDSLIYLDASTTTIEEKVEDALVPTLDAAWKPVLIDHYFGIRGGWGTGSMRREPAREGFALPYPLWHGAFVYKFDVPEQKYLGTISFELGYTEKGYAYLLYYLGDDVYTRKFSTIEFPILWQPYLPFGNGGRVYLSAGPFLSYTLKSWEKQYNKTTDAVQFDREYEMDPLTDYYLNYGIMAGVGLSIPVQKFLISLEGRYTIQLSDIMRGPEFVENAAFRTPVDNITVSLGVAYKFMSGKDRQRKKQLEKLRNFNLNN